MILYKSKNVKLYQSFASVEEHMWKYFYYFLPDNFFIQMNVCIFDKSFHVIT